MRLPLPLTPSARAEVSLGSTLFTTLVVTGYQHAYKNCTASRTELFEAAYAPDIEQRAAERATARYAFSRSGNGRQRTFFQQHATLPRSFASMTPPAASALTPPR